MCAEGWRRTSSHLQLVFHVRLFQGIGRIEQSDPRSEVGDLRRRRQEG